MSDEIRFQRRKRHGQYTCRAAPKPVGPPSDERYQDKSEKQIGQATQSKHSVGRKSRFVEEVVADSVIIALIPVLWIWIERKPIAQEERKGLKFFGEWWMSRIEAK